ncbi:hypothetical protein ATO6_12455 [Oceanicola sp. 22II-s10i]|uniref:hypothetical protein n=1 Tax=Oceanicola sp. 22II-s10i TaxID=1317116 RepID=UPI000B5223F0|nr:hypothetical protein [Oceanicola sp. 22II-s10i]OWU84491.1 hypothetical protein ATO6_12455 [Oceanicola sp. 22II-s10i]
MGSGTEPLGPPARDALYFNSATGLEHAGDSEAEAEAHWLIESIAGMLGADGPDWVIEDGDRKIGKLSLSLIRKQSQQGAALSLKVGRRGWTVTMSVAARHWVEIAVSTGAAEFVAYAERQYEEIELWPAGHRGEAWSISPGRMGKRYTWISLTAEGWPEIAGVAPSGVLNLYESGTVEISG